MADLISRQAAVSICDNAIDLWNGQLGVGALVAVRDAIKALPPVDVRPVQMWIPCSERLPQPNEEDADGFIKAYLVQDGRWMDVARWNGDCWIAWGYGTALTNVTAWMPLPKPWKDGEQNG